MLVHPHFNPVAFHLGPLPIRWYGLMYVLGFLAGWALGRFRAARSHQTGGSGWTGRQVDDVIALAVLGVVVGGRLGYVLFYMPSHFLAHPLDIFLLWKGGMSFHGGLLGVMAALWIFARRNRMPFLGVGDFLVPLVPLGLFFGRLGNFINGELWGRASNLPWAMLFADPKAGGVPRHPSQLYEAVLEGLVLFVAVWLYSRRPRAVGRVSGLFLLLYGCFRFSVEFVREPDSVVFLGWLTTGQALCLPMVGFGLWLLLRPSIHPR